jgi:hypothetical protein
VNTLRLFHRNPIIHKQIKSLKKMKKILFVFAIILGFSVVSFAQSSSMATKTGETKMELKDHVCTDACHSAGHCVFAHGEKGHVCTDACKMADNSSKMDMKDHVCTAACKNGNHMYAHGEKGHVCTKACKKKM